MMPYPQKVRGQGERVTNIIITDGAPRGSLKTVILYDSVSESDGLDGVLYSE